MTEGEPVFFQIDDEGLADAVAHRYPAASRCRPYLPVRRRVRGESRVV